MAVTAVTAARCTRWPTRPMAPPSPPADISKIEALGYRPVMSLRDGVQELAVDLGERNETVRAILNVRYHVERRLAAGYRHLLSQSQLTGNARLGEVDYTT